MIHNDVGDRFMGLSKECNRHKNELLSSKNKKMKKVLTPAQHHLNKLLSSYSQINKVKNKIKKLKKPANSHLTPNDTSNNNLSRESSRSRDPMSHQNLPPIPDKLQKEIDKTITEYNTNLNNFHSSYELALQEFEMVEQEHLSYTRSILNRYVELLKDSQVKLTTTYEQFDSELASKNENFLMHQLAEYKGTGTEKPKELTDVHDILKLGGTTTTGLLHTHSHQQEKSSISSFNLHSSSHHHPHSQQQQQQSHNFQSNASSSHDKTNSQNYISASGVDINNNTSEKVSKSSNLNGSGHQPDDPQSQIHLNEVSKPSPKQKSTKSGLRTPHLT